jgi:hypothetical protein
MLPGDVNRKRRAPSASANDRDAHGSKRLSATLYRFSAKE